MNELSVWMRSVITMSHKKWMKEHEFCYVKKIVAKDGNTTIKAKHCRDHNQLFILSTTTEGGME